MAAPMTLHVLDEEVTIVDSRRALVASHTSPGTSHVVEWDGEAWRCSCVGYGYRGHCRHLDALLAWYRGEAEAC